MENASKKKPRSNANHVKRATVPLSDGWSMVTHKSTRNLSQRLKQKDAIPHPDQHFQHARPAKIVNGLTVTALVEELRNMQSQWHTSPCAKRVEIILRRNDWNVSEAICLGIGSFSIDWEHRTRSIWQLVLFLAVVDQVSTGNAPVTLLAQEPCFNDMDKSFMKILGFSILQDNAAHSRITTKSFVYCPFVDWHILLPLVLQDRDPNLYIGNEVLGDYSPYKNSVRTSNPSASSSSFDGIVEVCNTISRNFLERRDVSAVPVFDGHQQALNGLMIYSKIND